MPLIKWAGGKRHFVKEFGEDMRALVKKKGGRYFEPFLGGAAMALHLELEGMVLNDVEDELIATYVAVRDEPEGVIQILAEMIDLGTDENTYNLVRSTEGSWITEIAARLIYLNALCYNGLYRKNRKGEFNVSFGDRKKVYFPKEQDVLQVSKALEGAELHCGDFSHVIGRAGAGDVIYADPPYHETFSGYSAGGFDDDDHERLAESLYLARGRGADFFCHNSDTEKVRYWYGDWTEIVPLQETRRINSKVTGRGAVGCVLVIGADDV